MKSEIELKIESLKAQVDNQKELIIKINNAIENEGFRPNSSQQATIDYICNRGRDALKEIDRLEKLMKGLN